MPNKPGLAETNPRLVAAANAALESIKPVGPDSAKETTFTLDDKEWWTKVTLDPHANTIERWDVLPAEDIHLRW